MSRETAIEYAEKLNCDPVDLMFNKLTIPVWAKANTLKTVEVEITTSLANYILTTLTNLRELLFQEIYIDQI